MNFTDLAAIIIVGALVIIAIVYSRKHACHGSCATCHAACSKRRPGDGSEVPDFVRRYRKDYPKKQPGNSK